MMEQLWTYFPAFLLIFARTASFFAAMPLFSYRTVPASYKIGMAFFFQLAYVFGRAEAVASIG